MSPSSGIHDPYEHSLASRRTPRENKHKQNNILTNYYYHSMQKTGLGGLKRRMSEEH